MNGIAKGVLSMVHFVKVLSHFTSFVKEELE